MSIGNRNKKVGLEVFEKSYLTLLMVFRFSSFG